MLENQKTLFNIPEEVTYLNTAYMSPLLKSVEFVGREAVSRKSRPFEIKGRDFFEPVEHLKSLFAELIGGKASQMAIIPSVSYGVANVVQNISMEKGQNIILLEGQFPSNVYPWMKLTQKYEGEIVTIAPKEGNPNRGEVWNQQILEAINEQTKVVALPHVHWADGTLFDLKTIGEKVRSVGGYLIIDGTQSIGAYPFSLQEIQADAVICAGYKWLLGGYSLGLAYYGDAFREATPIEDNWINRLGSEDFAQLVNYQEQYQMHAGRFSVGESSNFILVPMLSRAIEQILTWKVEEIQQYTHQISERVVGEMQSFGCHIEASNDRSSHLFGIKLPPHVNRNRFFQLLEEHQVFISQRGEFIRVSAHLFNEEKDFEKLLSLMKHTSS